MKIDVRKDERTINITGGAKMVKMSGDKIIIDGEELNVDMGEGRVHKTVEHNGFKTEMDATAIINFDHIENLIIDL